MTTAASGLRLRGDRDFRLYWWSRMLSTVGNAVTLVALPVLVYRLTASAFLTALVSALEAAAYVAFGLVAGALSDRHDRRRIMVAADLADAALLASVPIAHWAGLLTIPHVLLVAFAGPAVAVFFDGANFGALPVLVGRDRIAEANALVFGAATAVEMVAPALVGVGLAVVHPATLLAVDALSFAASAALVRAVTRVLYDADRVSSRLGGRGLFSEIGDGLRFLVAHDGVRTMTAVGTLQCMAGGAFVALDVVWCDQVLGIGTSGWRFGLVFSAWGVGGILADLALPRLLRRTTAARITLSALPASAVLGIATPFAGEWVLGAVGLFLWSCLYTLVTVNSISYRQQVTPEHLQGRVNTAGRMLAWGVGWTFGALAGGALAHLVGVRDALALMASLGLVACAVAWTSPLRTA